MERAGFEALLGRLADAWRSGDATAASACFAVRVDYADPQLYRFTSRAELLPFFEPSPGGHALTWHRILLDETAQTGVVEYTYVGHHRCHGAAVVEIDPDGLIARWREWQHREDERAWDDFLLGPAE